MLGHTTLAYEVNAKGRIVCNGRGIPYVRITLLDEDIDADDVVGTTVTDGNGNFRVRGAGSDFHWLPFIRRPDLYIRNELEHSSALAFFRVTLPRNAAVERSRLLFSRAGDVDFGKIVFNTDACLTYLRFYDATRNFYRRVGRRVPFRLVINTGVSTPGSRPYTLYKRVQLPKKSRLSPAAAKQELAHAVRYHYDGPLAHFKRDAVKYGYERAHSCSKRTNPGFAFNAGWAAWWAGLCFGRPASGPKSVEGNVAAALRSLQARCSTSNAQMWQVLQKNKRSIHSYFMFASRHKKMYKCS